MANRSDDVVAADRPCSRPHRSRRAGRRSRETSRDLAWRETGNRKSAVCRRGRKAGCDADADALDRWRQFRTGKARGPTSHRGPTSDPMFARVRPSNCNKRMRDKESYSKSVTFAYSGLLYVLVSLATDLWFHGLSLWRCLSYRGSAGGYLFIECRGVAALQMRSSQ